MNPTPRTPAQTPTPVLDFDARFLTAIIPARWRAAVLVAGAIAFFPLIITVMMFDAVTHDLPGLRAPFKRAFGIIGNWFRIPRVSHATDAMSFRALAEAPSSLHGSAV